MQTRQELDFNSIAIDCDRIKLEPISLKYSEVIFTEFTNEITRYMVPKTPSNIGEIDYFIKSSVENMINNIDITLVILKKNTEEFLGVCGLHGKSNPKEPVLGIWLKKSAHGNHYGQEAIKNLVEWTKNNISLNHMVYPCDKDNISSIKIAEHLNGTIFHQGQVKSMSGTVLNEVAYKIL